MAGNATLDPPPDFEQLLLVLCRQSSGDVHLDLAELGAFEVGDVIALLRGAATMESGRRLVLHNPPSAVRNVLDQLGPTLGTSRLCLR
jgi:STAS domain